MTVGPVGAVEHRRRRRWDGRGGCGGRPVGVPGSGDGSACPVDRERETRCAPAPSTPAGQVSTDLSPAVGRSGVERLRRATTAATGGRPGAGTGAERGRSGRRLPLRRRGSPVSGDAVCGTGRDGRVRGSVGGHGGCPARDADDQGHVGPAGAAPGLRGVPVRGELRARTARAADQEHTGQGARPAGVRGRAPRDGGARTTREAGTTGRRGEGRSGPLSPGRAA